ncbi:MAG: hypothetical protein HN553_11885 [Opitutae bacterium]|nr:hypothetical protein [Opitutae bacterium]
MLNVLKIHILSICSVCILEGQGVHLLLSEVGDGAYTKTEKKSEVDLGHASFLPLNEKIYVRPKSGIETLVAGFQFRFGFGTEFILNKGSIRLLKGSILIQSRKLNNKVFIKYSKQEIGISGVGTCMVEVTENKNLKIVGVLGRMLLGTKDDVILSDLLAGDLIQLSENDQSFGNKKNINLTRVVQTSFLISAFTNSKSFQSSIESMALAQNYSVPKENSIEIENPKPKEKGNNSDLEESSNFPSKIIGYSTQSYDVPSIDPLTELLGRQPTRSAPGLVKKQLRKSILNRLPGNLLRSRK